MIRIMIGIIIIIIALELMPDIIRAGRVTLQEYTKTHQTR